MAKAPRPTFNPPDPTPAWQGDLAAILAGVELARAAPEASGRSPSAEHVTYWLNQTAATATRQLQDAVSRLNRGLMVRGDVDLRAPALTIRLMRQRDVLFRYQSADDAIDTNMTADELCEAFTAACADVLR